MVGLRRVSAIVGALSALAAPPALASSIFIATPEGDWFDGTSWSTGVAPGAADDAVIDDGATATASSGSPLYPGAGTIEVNSLAVGSRIDAASPSRVSGALELVDVDLAIAGDLSIGTNSDSAVGSTASGSLRSVGGSQTSGNLSVEGSTRVGFGVQSDGPEDAAGTLVVGGDFQTRETLSVGAGIGSEVSVGGDVRIVPSDPDSTGAVAGSVSVGTSGIIGSPDTPTLPTLGSLSVAGNLALDSGESFKSTLLSVGSGVGAARSDGRVDVHGDVLGFRLVEVGVATAGFPEDGETISTGELHVDGKLDEVASYGRPTPGFPALLSVGVTRVSFGGSPGRTRAEGYATIGEIEPRSVEVGVAAGAGPAVGVLEIGSGDLGAASVGESRGDADAQGTVVTGGSVASAAVGTSQGGGIYSPACGCFTPFSTGNVSGSLTANGSGLIAAATVGSGDSDGSASGYLSVEGFGRDGGSPGSGLLVGVSSRGAGTADGQMIVRSGGIHASYINVGRIAGSAGVSQPPANANVTGFLESTGDVTSSSYLFGDVVGYANAKSGGRADGTWIMHDGTYTGTKLIVGLNEGTGSATGTIHLDDMLAHVDDITLGDGATVELEIRGLLRGDEYSAIAATVAKLNGALAVQFVGPAQLGVYDLLVSGGIDGITGDFDAVSVSGLAADQQAFWGIETIGANPVEVFRLHVVPEPQTGALLTLGIVGLAIRGRRTRAAA
jgi:hypothetical protein